MESVYREVTPGLKGSSELVSSLGGGLDWRGALLDALLCVALFICVGLCVRSSLLESFYVTSRSMSPTLKQDDFIVVPKLAYGLHLPFIERPVVSWRAPSRGEVVVVNRADDPSTLEDEGSQTVVKRVVGISGDRIAIVGDRVKVNGESLVEDYAVWGGGVARARRLSFVVPEGSVFLMGDNRDESDDSRNWRQPFIPISRVIGPVGVVYWSKGGFAPPARVARY